MRNLRWQADSHSARGRVTKDSQALSHLHLYCLTGDNKSQEQSFCFRETLRKTLTTFRVATFRIFRRHRCILNLPCVLRTCSVSRSPSHQPSTSHHCVLCRWLGESSLTYQTLYFLMVNHYTMMKSQIEVKRYVFHGWAVALASLVVSKEGLHPTKSLRELSTTSLSQGNFSSLSQSLNYIIANSENMSSIILSFLNFFFYRPIQHVQMVIR